MKKITFIIFFLAGSLVSRSQQLITGKGIKFTLPDEAEHLKSSNGPKMTDYKIGDITLSYRDSSKKYNPNSLENYKASRDNFLTTGESALSPNNYTSFIKMYTHSLVAVYRIGDKESEGSYFFYAVNKEKTWYFIGHFDYKKGDLAKADKFLTDLLNSLEFTK